MKNFSKFLLIPTFLLISINITAQDSETSLSGNILIEEVVVTARKKEESAQDVPVALTAMSQEQLEI